MFQLRCADATVRRSAASRGRDDRDRPDVPAGNGRYMERPGDTAVRVGIVTGSAAAHVMRLAEVRFHVRTAAVAR